jgi:hypothetical protein
VKNTVLAATSPAVYAPTAGVSQPPAATVPATLAARPLMSVELSTVTGTRTGATTMGSASIGSVGRVGSDPVSGTTGAALLGLAGGCAVVSFSSGET